MVLKVETLTLLVTICLTSVLLVVMEDAPAATCAAASGTRSVLYAAMVLVRYTMVLTEVLMATLALVTSSATATTATTSSTSHILVV